MSSPTSDLASIAATVLDSIAPNSVEIRRQRALAAAKQCNKVLVEEFEATEVIVFGSLRGDTPWHDRSDLDLAVRGISRDFIFEAYRRLEDIVPSWLSFDLVAIERADDGVRDRILQVTPMRENIFLNTKIRLEDELRAIEKTIATLETLLAQAETVPTIALTPALAAYIEDFYSRCERTAERIAVSLDGGLPTGDAWHQKLLSQVSAQSAKGRPPLWSKDLLRTLDGYRTFRHRVRHLYNIDLDDDRVLELANAVPAIFGEVQQTVTVFSGWLIEQSNSRGQ